MHECVLLQSMTIVNLDQGSPSSEQHALNNCNTSRKPLLMLLYLFYYCQVHVEGRVAVRARAGGSSAGAATRSPHGGGAEACVS